MAWHRTGDKPLSVPMMWQFTDAYLCHSPANCVTHYYVLPLLLLPSINNLKGKIWLNHISTYSTEKSRNKITFERKSTIQQTIRKHGNEWQYGIHISPLKSQIRSASYGGCTYKIIFYDTRFDTKTSYGKVSRIWKAKAFCSISTSHWNLVDVSGA